MSSAGTDGSVPCRTDTRSVRPPAVIVRTRSGASGAGRLLVEDIRTRRRRQLLHVADHGRRGDLVPPPLAEPGHEVGPPRARHPLGAGEPLLRPRRGWVPAPG